MDEYRHFLKSLDLSQHSRNSVTSTISGHSHGHKKTGSKYISHQDSKHSLTSKNFIILTHTNTKRLSETKTKTDNKENNKTPLIDENKKNSVDDTKTFPELSPIPPPINNNNPKNKKNKPKENPMVSALFHLISNIEGFELLFKHMNSLKFHKFSRKSSTMTADC